MMKFTGTQVWNDIGMAVGMSAVSDTSRFEARQGGNTFALLINEIWSFIPFKYDTEEASSSQITIREREFTLSLHLKAV